MADGHFHDHFVKWHIAKVTRVNVTEETYDIEFVFGYSHANARTKAVPKTLIRTLRQEGDDAKWKNMLSDNNGTNSRNAAGNKESRNGLTGLTLTPSKAPAMLFAVGDVVEVNVDRGTWSDYPVPDFYEEGVSLGEP